MDGKDDGGQAFPTTSRYTENYMDEAGYGRTRTVSANVGGMSLRDYFAGQALPGILSSTGTSPTNAVKPWTQQGVSYNQWCAGAAYEIADAMIAARKGGAK